MPSPDAEHTASLSGGTRAPGAPGDAGTPGDAGDAPGDAMGDAPGDAGTPGDAGDAPGDAMGDAPGDAPAPASAPEASTQKTSDLAMSTPATSPPAGVTVRRARFVDVPGVARLLTADHPVVDLDGDGAPDSPGDPEQLSSATRLVLSHGIMEQGEVWVAEDADGLRATTVWLPPEVPAFEDELRGVLVREVGVDPLDVRADDEPVRVATRQALGVAQAAIADALDQVRPRLILVAAAVAPDIEGQDRIDTVRLLVDAPASAHRSPSPSADQAVGVADQAVGVADQAVEVGHRPLTNHNSLLDGNGARDGDRVGPLLTAVVDPSRVEGMRRIGFVEHRSVDLVPHGRLWIGVRA